MWVPEEGRDPGDAVILTRAFEEDRVLVTADKDFGEVVFVFRQPHPTIIRLVDVRAKEQGRMILGMVQRYGPEFGRHPLITAERSRVRIKYATEEE